MTARCGQFMALPPPRRHDQRRPGRRSPGRGFCHADQSGTPSQGTTWGFNYHYDRQDFPDFSEVEFEEASVDLGYKLSGSVRDLRHRRRRERLARAPLTAPAGRLILGARLRLCHARPRTISASRSASALSAIRWVSTGCTPSGDSERSCTYFEDPSTNAGARFQTDDTLQIPGQRARSTERRLRVPARASRGAASLGPRPFACVDRSGCTRKSAADQVRSGRHRGLWHRARQRRETDQLDLEGGRAHETSCFGLGWERSELTDGATSTSSAAAPRRITPSAALRVAAQDRVRDARRRPAGQRRPGRRGELRRDSRVALHRAQLLLVTPMYRSFYGFTGKPFQLTPDLRFLYPSSGHKRAMAYLRYGLEQAEGFVVITGDIGTGKTLLIQTLLEELSDQSIATARVAAANLEAGARPRRRRRRARPALRGKSKELITAQPREALLHAPTISRACCSCVDEAQTLSRAIARGAAHPLEPEANGQRAAADLPRRADRSCRTTLRGSRMRQLRQRVVVVPSSGAAHTPRRRKRYVGFRLLAVGWKTTPSFTHEVYERVHAQTRGRPAQDQSADGSPARVRIPRGDPCLRGETTSTPMLKEMGAELSGDIENATPVAEPVAPGPAAEAPASVPDRRRRRAAAPTRRRMRRESQLTPLRGAAARARGEAGEARRHQSHPSPALSDRSAA